MFESQRMRRVIERGKIEHQPFPHFVVDGLITDGFYRKLLRDWPKRDFFATHGALQGSISETAEGAGWMSFDFPCDQAEQHIGAWAKFRRLFVENAVPAIAKKIGGETVARDFMIDRVRNCVLAPHVDSLDYNVTIIYFVADDTTRAHLGTLLYEHVSGPLPSIATQRTARSAQWAHILGAETREAGMIEFLPNRLLVFLNSPTSWHGQILTEDTNRKSYNVFLSG